MKTENTFTRILFAVNAVLSPILTRIGIYAIFVLAGCALQSQVGLANPRFLIAYIIPLSFVALGHGMLRFIEACEAREEKGSL